MKITSTATWPTENDQLKLRASFVRLMPKSEKIFGRVYERMFESQPHMSAMFNHDFARQYDKLGMAIAAAIDLLASPETFDASCAELGIRHAMYGATREDFEKFGTVLIEEITIGAFPPFSSQVIALWENLYILTADRMLTPERAQIQRTILGH